MSRVLLVGATGFIGRHLAASLVAAGHGVTRAGRAEIDLAKKPPAEIAARLAGHDVVINTAGLAGDAAGQTMWAVHRAGIARLIATCRTAGVPRLIHLSALGAAPEGGTRFQRSKGAGEAL